MNFYSILKVIGLKSIPPFTKLLGLWAMLLLRRRSIAVYFDPVLACNLKCKMCYFSDPVKRAEMHGVISDSSIEAMQRLLLPHALKLQIGCGAEPSLYPNLERIVKDAKIAGVPYVCITTNGQLFGAGKADLKKLVDAGLDEITLSVHGTDPETYQELMPGAKFDNLLNLIEQLAELRKSSAKPVIRVNFTINSLNLKCLKDNNFFDIWDKRGIMPDIIQLRPVQNLGDTLWNDFDLTPVIQNYDETVGNTVNRAAQRNIKCLVPSRDDLTKVDNVQDGVSAIIEDIAYCYVSPSAFYKPDFNPDSDTFAKYHKRNKTLSKLFKATLRGAKARERKATKKLNYKVK